MLRRRPHIWRRRGTRQAAPELPASLCICVTNLVKDRFSEVVNTTRIISIVSIMLVTVCSMFLAYSGYQMQLPGLLDQNQQPNALFSESLMFMGRMHYFLGFTIFQCIMNYIDFQSHCFMFI